MSASVPSSTWWEPDRQRRLSRKTSRKATRDRRAPGGARSAVLPAKPSDHPAICHFLTAVFHGPSREEFRASLEDPFYEPQDRLLVKRGSQIIAHVHHTRRLMQFGPLQIPVAGLSGLGVAPGFHGQGHGAQLLTAAEKQMAADGALVGLLWTRTPGFFRRTGWALCCGHCRCRATTRDLLSGLEALGLHRVPLASRQCHRRKRLNIRPWRRMELGALVRIYAQNLAHSYGPFQRTEAYWRWLVNRKAYDQIYVALDGPDLLELEECHAPIVGYAITLGERIIELFTTPGRGRAAAELLARACGDAIERGQNTITLHSPPGSRLDKLFRKAGGKPADCRTCTCQVLMAKLLDPLKLLRALAGELHRRAEAANLPGAINLGLLVDGKKYRLAISPQSVGITGRNIARSYLRLNIADFTRLVLGHLDWNQALSDGRVVASTQIAIRAGRALFPRLPLWRPPLDELSA